MIKNKMSKIQSNSELLLEYMKKHSMTKKQFAEFAGLTTHKIDGFLKNKNVASTTLVKISQATKIRVDDLLNYMVDES